VNNSPAAAELSRLPRESPGVPARQRLQLLLPTPSAAFGKKEKNTKGATLFQQRLGPGHSKSRWFRRGHQPPRHPTIACTLWDLLLPF